MANLEKFLSPWHFNSRWVLLLLNFIFLSFVTHRKLENFFTQFPRKFSICEKLLWITKEKWKIHRHGKFENISSAWRRRNKIWFNLIMTRLNSQRELCWTFSLSYDNKRKPAKWMISEKQSRCLKGDQNWYHHHWYWLIHNNFYHFLLLLDIFVPQVPQEVFTWELRTVSSFFHINSSSIQINFISFLFVVHS